MIPTDFSQIIGNDVIKSYLKRMVDHKAIANSLLFSGPDGIGKSLFAGVLAASLICQNDPTGSHKYKIESGNHPDIYHYRPEGKLGIHSIQSLRQLIEEVYLPPYEADWKVFIIHDADRMLSYSANALLKTFEEPPANTIIILLTSLPEALIPTILSRCRKIYFQSLSNVEIREFLKKKYESDEITAAKFAALAQGSISKAIQLVEKKGHPNREVLLNILGQGNLKTYKALTNGVDVLVENIEARKKEIEQVTKEDLYKVPTEHLSAVQQQFLEKELEGVVAMGQIQEAYSLLELILFWYRDLHLLLLGGDTRYLMNPDYYEHLEQAVQRGSLLPIEKVQKAIDEARLSLQRSTSLQVCLENLFLKLNLI